MSRRNKKKKLVQLRNNRTLISSIVNIVMLRGKKSLAERIVYEAIERVKKVLNTKIDNPTDLLLVVLENTRPEFEVKSRRIGGATYQVPIEIGYERQKSLVLHWIVRFARLRKGIPMKIALALEIIDAYRGIGSLVKKKEEINNLAKSNRAFAHLRW